MKKKKKKNKTKTKKQKQKNKTKQTNKQRGGASKYTACVLEEHHNSVKNTTIKKIQQIRERMTT